MCAAECESTSDCGYVGDNLHCCGLSNVAKSVCVPTAYDNGMCMAN